MSYYSKVIAPKTNEIIKKYENKELIFDEAIEALCGYPIQHPYYSALEMLKQVDDPENYLNDPTLIEARAEHIAKNRQGN